MPRVQPRVCVAAAAATILFFVASCAVRRSSTTHSDGGSTVSVEAVSTEGPSAARREQPAPEPEPPCRQLRREPLHVLARGGPLNTSANASYLKDFYAAVETSNAACLCPVFAADGSDFVRTCALYVQGARLVVDPAAKSVAVTVADDVSTTDYDAIVAVAAGCEPYMHHAVRVTLHVSRVPASQMWQGCPGAAPSLLLTAVAPVFALHTPYHAVIDSGVLPLSPVVRIGREAARRYAARRMLYNASGAEAWVAQRESRTAVPPMVEQLWKLGLGVEKLRHSFERQTATCSVAATVGLWGAVTPYAYPAVEWTRGHYAAGPFLTTLRDDMLANARARFDSAVVDPPRPRSDAAAACLFEERKSDSIMRIGDRRRGWTNATLQLMQEGLRVQCAVHPFTPSVPFHVQLSRVRASYLVVAGEGSFVAWLPFARTGSTWVIVYDHATQAAWRDWFFGAAVALSMPHARLIVYSRYNGTGAADMAAELLSEVQRLPFAPGVTVLEQARDGACVVRRFTKFP